MMVLWGLFCCVLCLPVVLFACVFVFFSSRGSWGWTRLPRGPGENACESHATLALGPGRGVATVVNVHLGNEGDTEIQVDIYVFHVVFCSLLRSRLIEDMVNSSKHPASLCLNFVVLCLFR